jgi:hypothetical protein
LLGLGFINHNQECQGGDNPNMQRSHWLFPLACQVDSGHLIVTWSRMPWRFQAGTSP